MYNSKLDAVAGRLPYVVATVLLLCLEACFLEPSTSLTGQWGGRGVLLDARASDVRLDFLCKRAVASDLLIDGSGRFEGAAQVTGVSWTGPAPTTLRLSGKVADGVMSLSIAAVWPPHGAQTDTIITHESYTLQRGAPPDFGGYACVA